MLAISETISREFAPRFTRSEAAGPKPMAFSAQELLAISQEISREHYPLPVEHRSTLVLLPIDPRRLHAYWHLAESSRPAAPPTAAAEPPLTLRIYKHPPAPAIEPEDQAQPASWFDIPIDSGQCRQEVILPAETNTPGTSYQAAIGFMHDKQYFTAITVSNAADMPQPPLAKGETGLPDAVAQFSLSASRASSPIGNASALRRETQGV